MQVLVELDISLLPSCPLRFSNTHLINLHVLYDLITDIYPDTS